MIETKHYKDTAKDAGNSVDGKGDDDSKVIEGQNGELSRHNDVAVQNPQPQIVESESVDREP